MMTYLAVQHVDSEEIILGASTSRAELVQRVKRDLVVAAIAKATTSEDNYEIKTLADAGMRPHDAIAAIMGANFLDTITAAVNATWHQIKFERVPEESLESHPVA